jgi:tetratricopeptide (TPR) repeat protein
MNLQHFRTLLTVALAVIILLPGCGGAQSLAKRGDRMNEAGHYNEAADFYHQALTRNRNNLRARMGMIETGQKSLNDRLDRFNRTNNMGQHRDAVTQYREAEAYRQKIRRVGVDLNIPDHYTQDYNISKGIVLEDLYDQAMDLMDEGRYDQANALLKEVKELDPNFRDTQELSSVAFSKPLYLQGKVALDNGAYRMAYDYFAQILQRTPNFKDTRELQQEALDKGRTTVAIVPFENVSNEPNVEKRVSAYILDELSRIPDPFLRFVDRGDMDKIIEEQQLSLSGIFNDETAIQVGELLGAKAIITGKVLEYRNTEGRLQSTRRNGFEGYQVQRRSPETGAIYYETRYKPVTYTEYTAANSVMITFQYRLLSLETGEVLVSRIVERESKDGIHYAAYDGNAAMLYPASGSARNASNAAKRQLDNTLRARRNLKSSTELSNALFSSISSELSREVSDYMSRQ